jgi:hypothetical protein
MQVNQSFYTNLYRNSFIIEDQVVCKYDRTLSIGPINAWKKRGFNTERLSKKEFGSVFENRRVLSMLLEGTVNFDDVRSH